MNRFRKTFSIRKKKKKEEGSSSSTPQTWLDDEKRIKDGSCSFQVKYLGNIEVFESRGMQVCEEAIKALRKSKKKPQRAILFVSGDALRVSDEISKHLIVDQTIEKVSFCAPDRNHDRGFAYICRDGATRRWMCHAFLAVKESGERLSHAVGCAFAICLEKKQKRERDALQVTFSDDRTSFTRMSSFRQTTLTERLIDPQSAIVAEPLQSEAKEPIADSEVNSLAIVLPNNVTHSTSASAPQGAIPRPRASPSMIERQGSLRLFPKLQETSPFKQHLSLRLGELPSNLQRLNRLMNGDMIPEETADEVDEHLNGLFSNAPVAATTVTTIMSTLPSCSHFSTNSSASNPAFGSPSFARNTAVLSNASSAPNTATNAWVTNTAINSAPITTLTDPFSAAPFNPATIQQHHNQQQQQPHGLIQNFPLASVPAVTVASILPGLQSAPQWPPAISAVPIATPCLPPPPTSSTSQTISPFMGGPPIAAPATGTSPPRGTVGAALFGASPAVAPSSLFAFPPIGGTPGRLPPPPANATHVTNVFGAANGPSTTWLPSPGPLLPPEPDRLTDPFDVGWAERATAAVNGQLAAFNPVTSADPFSCLTAPSPFSSVNMGTNPFLASPLPGSGVAASQPSLGSPVA